MSQKRLDRIQKQASTRVTNPDQLILPSIALRSSETDAAVVDEIKALMRDIKDLEESLAQCDSTRLHLEKLQNEKRDTLRKIKELREEDKQVQRQLEIKRAELEELEAMVKPSPVRQQYEAEVDRLRKEINSNSALRTQSEREGAMLAKRLLRVRTVLGPFLKAEGLNKPQQPLPPADDELAAKLTEHVVGLANKVASLEQTVAARELRTAELSASAEEAAAELKRLVAKRSAATRHRVAAQPVPVSAIGLLTEPADVTAALPPATTGEGPKVRKGKQKVQSRTTDEGLALVRPAAKAAARKASATETPVAEAAAAKADSTAAAAKAEAAKVEAAKEEAAKAEAAKAKVAKEQAAAAEAAAAEAAAAEAAAAEAAAAEVAAAEAAAAEVAAAEAAAAAAAAAEAAVAEAEAAEVTPTAEVNAAEETAAEAAASLDVTETVHEMPPAGMEPGE